MLSDEFRARVSDTLGKIKWHGFGDLWVRPLARDDEYLARELLSRGAEAFRAGDDQLGGELVDEVVELRFRGGRRGPMRVWKKLDRHRLAVVVPFRDSPRETSNGRDRASQLRCFVRYMKGFLGRLGRDFDLLVIEQTEGPLFNKGALFNVGCVIARSQGADYVVLHDVDQLPESPRNTYGFPRRPTHLCTASSQFGYGLPYKEMVGGALAISLRDYFGMNGYSNSYWGWGQEDDDFYFRLVRVFGTDGIRRLEGRVGCYRALDHHRVDGLDQTPVFRRNREILSKMAAGQLDYSADGTSSVKYDLVDVDRRPDFSRYLVDFKFDRMPHTLGV